MITSEGRQQCDIFVSYSRRDSAEIGQLREALQKQNLGVWQDASSIETGDAITSAIKAGLSSCKLVVIWYSDSYPTRPACQQELLFAFTSALHRGGPSSRLFVVNPLPTFDHILPLSLRDQKFARSLIEPQIDFQSLASLIAQRVRELDSVLGEAMRQPMVYALGGESVSSSPRFVERVRESWELHDGLWLEGHSMTSGISRAHPTAIVGLGGMGKTMLAQEYAMRFAGAYPGGIFWLGAAIETKSQDDFESLRRRRWSELSSRLSSDSDSKNDTFAKIESRLAKTLDEAALPYLWVVDDVPAGMPADHVKRWFAPSLNGKTLVTTRFRPLDQICSCVDLDTGMNETEALNLLLGEFPTPPKTDIESAQAICRTLGFHPLALAVASAALAKSTTANAFRSYLRSLEKSLPDEIERNAKLLGSLPTGHEKSIVNTLSRSIRDLSKDSREILSLLVISARRPFPVETIPWVLTESHAIDWATAEHRTEVALHELENCCLCRLAKDGVKVISAHVLVLAAAESIPLNATWEKILQEGLASALSQEFALTEYLPDHAKLEALVPHAEMIAKRCEGRSGMVLNTIIAQHLTSRSLEPEAKARLESVAPGLSSTLLPMNIASMAVRLMAAHGLHGDSPRDPASQFKFSFELHQKIFGSEEFFTKLAELDYWRFLASSDASPEFWAAVKQRVKKLDASTLVKERWWLPEFRVLLATLLSQQGRDREAALQLISAANMQTELCFSGNGRRIEMSVLEAEALMRSGHIVKSEALFFRNATSSAQLAFFESAKYLGYNSPLTFRAAKVWASCLEAAGKTVAAENLRIGLLGICSELLTNNPARFAFLQKLAGWEWPPCESARESKDIRTACKDVELAVAQWESADAIDDAIDEKAEAYFGKDFIVSLISRPNRIMTQAHKAAQEGDFHLAAVIASEAIRYISRNRGVESARTLTEELQAGIFLNLAGDQFSARAMLWALLRKHVHSGTSCCGQASEAAWLLLDPNLPGMHSLIGRHDHKLMLLRKYLSWMLKEKAENLHPDQRAMLDRVHNMTNLIDHWVSRLLSRLLKV